MARPLFRFCMHMLFIMAWQAFLHAPCAMSARSRLVSHFNGQTELPDFPASFCRLYMATTRQLCFDACMLPTVDVHMSVFCLECKHASKALGNHVSTSVNFNGQKAAAILGHAIVTHSM